MLHNSCPFPPFQNSPLVWGRQKFQGAEKGESNKIYDSIAKFWYQNMYVAACVYFSKKLYFASSELHFPKECVSEQIFDPQEKPQHACIQTLHQSAKQGIYRPELWDLICLQFWFLYFHDLKPYMEI